MNFNEIPTWCPPDEHCYHREGVILSSVPQYRMVCCHCGHTKYTQIFPEKKVNHGPFYRG